MSAFGVSGISNLSPLSTLDGVSDGLLPYSSPQFLVRNALWPSNAWNLTETGVDEDLHASPGFRPIQKNSFDVAVEQSQCDS